MRGIKTNGREQSQRGTVKSRVCLNSFGRKDIKSLLGSYSDFGMRRDEPIIPESSRKAFIKKLTNVDQDECIDDNFKLRTRDQLQKIKDDMFEEFQFAQEQKNLLKMERKLKDMRQADQKRKSRVFTDFSVDTTYVKNKRDRQRSKTHEDELSRYQLAWSKERNRILKKAAKLKRRAVLYEYYSDNNIDLPNDEVEYNSASIVSMFSLVNMEEATEKLLKNGIDQRTSTFLWSLITMLAALVTDAHDTVKVASIGAFANACGLSTKGAVISALISGALLMGVKKMKAKKKAIDPEFGEIKYQFLEEIHRVGTFIEKTLNAEFVVALRKLIIGMVAYTAFPTSMAAKVFSFIGTNATKMSGLKFIATISDVMAKLGRSATMWWRGNEKGEAVPISEILFGASHYDSIRDRYQILDMYKNATYSGLPIRGHMCRFYYMREAAAFLSYTKIYLAEIGRHHPDYREVSDWRINVIKWEMDIASRARSMNRIPPFAVLVYGQPGTGKSITTKVLASRVAAMKGYEFNENQVFYKNSSSQFWEGYSTQQHNIVFMSEAGKMHADLVQKAGDPTMDAFLSCIDSNPYFVDMAFEGKGKVPFLAELFILDSNNKTMNLKKLYSNPAAFARRFYTFEQRVKAEYRKPGSSEIDSEKFLATGKFLMEAFEYKVFANIPKGPVDWEERLISTEWCGYQEMIEIFDRLFIAHQARGAKVNRTLNDVIKSIPSKYKIDDNNGFNYPDSPEVIEDTMGIYGNDLKPDLGQTPQAIVNKFVNEYIPTIDEARDTMINLRNKAMDRSKKVVINIVDHIGTAMFDDDWSNPFTVETQCDYITDHVAFSEYVAVSTKSGGDEEYTTLLPEYKEEFSDLSDPVDVRDSLLSIGNRLNVNYNNDVKGVLLVNATLTDKLKSTTNIIVGNGIPATRQLAFEIESMVKELEQEPNSIVDKRSLTQFVSAVHEYSSNLRHRLSDVVGNDEKKDYEPDPFGSIAMPQTENPDLKVDIHPQMAVGLNMNHTIDFKDNKALVEQVCNKLMRTCDVVTSFVEQILMFFSYIYSVFDVFMYNLPSLIMSIASIISCIMTPGLFTYTLTGIILVCLYMSRSMYVPVEKREGHRDVVTEMALRAHNISDAASAVSNINREYTREERNYMADKATMKWMGNTALAAIILTITAKTFHKVLRILEHSAPKYNAGFSKFDPEQDDHIETDSGCKTPYIRVKNKLDNWNWNVKSPMHVQYVHTSGGDTFKAMILANTFTTFFEHGDSIIKSHCLGVSGCYALVNTHHHRAARDAGKMINCTLGREWDKVMFTLSTADGEYIDIGGDLTIAMTTRNFRDLVKHMALRNINVGTSYIEDKEVSAAFIPHGIAIEGWDNIPYAYRYYGYNGEGLCGNALYSKIGTGWAIIGIHCAGTGDGKIGFSTALYRDKIESAVTALSKQMGIFKPHSTLNYNSVVDRAGPIRTNPKSLAFYEELDNMEYFGTVGRVEINKKSLVKDNFMTPHIAKLEKITGIPKTKVFVAPMMKPEMRNGEYVAPQNVAIKHFTHPIALGESKILKRAVDYLTKRLTERIHDELGEIKLAPYYTKHAINGSEDDKYLRRINTSTAAGYNFPGKKEKYLPIESEAPFVRVPDASVCSRMREIFKCYDNGDMSGTVFTVSLKDEPVTKQKRDDAVTRLFYVHELPHLIVARMFLGPIVTLIQQTDAFYSMVGINVYVEGDKIVNRLTKFPNYIEADAKKFDITAAQLIRQATFAIVYNLCKELGYNSVALNYLAGVLSDLLFPLYSLDGDLFRKSSVPSGHYGTAELNCLIVMLFMVIAFIEGQDRGEIPKDADFFDHVSAAYYGDDQSASVSDDVKESVNNVTIAALYERFNMQLTASDKSLVIPKFVPFSEATFLKRTFRFSKVHNKYICPLDPQSIYKMSSISVFSDKCTEREHAISIANSALGEWYLHFCDCDDPEAKYNEIRNIYIDAFVAHFGNSVGTESFFTFEKVFLIPTNEKLSA